MTEEKTTEGSTTINQYPNNTGWGGAPYGGWGGYGYPVAVPAYGGYGNGFGDLMRGFGGNINIGRGGNALGVVGTVLGAVALGAPLLRGAFGGFGPGNGGPCCDFVTQRELSLVEKNNTLAAENGQLKAQIYTDNKTDAVIKTLVEWRQRQELIDTQIAGEVATLKAENANLKARLGSMLGEYIAPQVMLPSQAVATQIQSAKTTAAASGS